MDKNEERLRNSTLVQLWNDQLVDRERIDTGEMSELEAWEHAEFWHRAAELYRDARDKWRRWQSICRKPSRQRRRHSRNRRQYLLGQAAPYGRCSRRSRALRSHDGIYLVRPHL
jgi:hypothetical protein